jgi:hypothetical protein
VGILQLVYEPFGIFAASRELLQVRRSPRTSREIRGLRGALSPHGATRRQARERPTAYNVSKRPKVNRPCPPPSGEQQWHPPSNDGCRTEQI